MTKNPPEGITVPIKPVEVDDYYEKGRLLKEKMIALCGNEACCGLDELLKQHSFQALQYIHFLYKFDDNNIGPIKFVQKLITIGLNSIAELRNIYDHVRDLNAKKNAAISTEEKIRIHSKIVDYLYQIIKYGDQYEKQEEEENVTGLVLQLKRRLMTYIDFHATKGLEDVFERHANELINAFQELEIFEAMKIVQDQISRILITHTITVDLLESMTNKIRYIFSYRREEALDYGLNFT